MITDAILGWLLAGTEWVVALLPSSTGAMGGLSLAFSNLGALDYFIPITEAYALTIGFWRLMAPAGLVALAIWIVVGVVRGGSVRA